MADLLEHLVGHEGRERDSLSIHGSTRCRRAIGVYPIQKLQLMPKEGRIPSHSSGCGV